MIPYLTVTVDTKILMRRLKAWEPLVEDALPMLRLAAQRIQEDLRANFDREGPRWRQLRPRTVKAREAGYGHYKQYSMEGPAHRILHWTYGLRRSMTDRNVAGAVWRESRNRIEFGSNLRVGSWSLARIHHFGGGNVPARPLYRAARVQSIFFTTARQWGRELVRQWKGGRRAVG